MKEWMKDTHYELASTLYKQWIRKANNAIKLPTRESSPCKQKASGKKLFRGASAKSVVTADGDDDSAHAARTGDDFDPVAEEIERWARLPADHYEAAEDGQQIRVADEEGWAGGGGGVDEAEALA